VGFIFFSNVTAGQQESQIIAGKEHQVVPTVDFKQFLQLKINPGDGGDKGPEDGVEQFQDGVEPGNERVGMVTENGFGNHLAEEEDHGSGSQGSPTRVKDGLGADGGDFLHDIGGDGGDDDVDDVVADEGGAENLVRLLDELQQVLLLAVSLGKMLQAEPVYRDKSCFHARKEKREGKEKQY
jgi:hypothetical protein